MSCGFHVNHRCWYKSENKNLCHHSRRVYSNHLYLEQMIVVLTDGNFAKSGSYNDSALQQMVLTLKTEGVIVFFFSVGDDTQTEPDPLIELRSLSCLMNSTVNHVSLTDAQRNPLWAIRPYFDYQASLRSAANNTFWTETYIDFDGLGNVSTVTFPGQLFDFCLGSITCSLGKKENSFWGTRPVFGIKASGFN